MIDLSESYYCARWVVELEYKLWEQLETRDKERQSRASLDDQQLHALTRLAKECKKWVIFDEQDEHTFVSIEQWQSSFARWKSNS
ncbi:MAG: hypothetical protein JJ957_13835 [Pseudomonadales bacterium]|nr:hypothetical protein [Pseudomonadales bacterium]MBO6596602.1 hypothetical protein [Pseudomonadales bacterium]MBO6823409.1 hypothetical protein [Pseudomonadales bacterium]